MIIVEHIKQVWPVETDSGALTLQVETVLGTKCFLHSVHDPEKEATEWLKRVKLTSDTAYIVYGFGLGYHVKALLDHLPQNSKIFVIEYSKEESLAIAAAQILPAESKEWLRDERIIYLSSQVIRVIANYISQHMREHLLGEIRVLRHVPTMELFPEFYGELEKSLVAETIELLSFNVAFAIKHAPVLLSNSWSNLPFIASSAGNTVFFNSFSQIPAIIVSSGPSLDNNIELLKDYKDKAVIIAAGTALRALRKRNITPHFVAIIDPFIPGFIQLADYLEPEVLLLSTYDTNKNLVAEYPGPKVFCRATGADMLAELSDYLPQASIFSRNGSVATIAFDFALYIDADPIIFIGQDMALSNNRSHAAGLSQDISHKTDLPDSNYLYVEGYYRHGQTVKSNNFLNDLRLYFSSRIKAGCQNKLIINATQGGAYLDGAEHLSLQEVQNRYLTKTFEITGIINNCLQAKPKPPDDFKHLKLNEEIQKIREVSKKILEQLDLFEKQIQQTESVCTEEYLISQFKDFFADFQTSSVYPYLKFYIDACYLMQTLENRTGASYEKQLTDWKELFRNIKKVLNILAFESR